MGIVKLLEDFAAASASQLLNIDGAEIVLPPEVYFRCCLGLPSWFGISDGAVQDGEFKIHTSAGSTLTVKRKAP